MKKGVPTGVLTFFKQGSCSNERENNHFAYSCSNSSVEPLAKSNSGAKAFFGLSLPNFGGLDLNDKAQASSCGCCCQARQDCLDLETKSVARLFLGFSMQGFSFTNFNGSGCERDATSRCCCAKGKMDNRIDTREPGFEQS